MSKIYLSYSGKCCKGNQTFNITVSDFDAQTSLLHTGLLVVTKLVTRAIECNKTYYRAALRPVHTEGKVTNFFIACHLLIDLFLLLFFLIFRFGSRFRLV